MFHDNKGFTLVEVIVSALILFSAISIGTVAHRKMIRLVENITVGVTIEDALPNIMEIVKSDIMDRKSRGEGNYGKFIRFSWYLKEIRSSRNIVNSYDETDMGVKYGKFFVSLNKIILNIVYEYNDVKKKSEYEYKEILCYR